jgi:myo-inositol-1(or 4)-monophosphatase
MMERREIDNRQLSEFVEFACRLGEAAGRAILPHFRADLDVENKAPTGYYDPVTVADRAAESAIRDEIRRVYPRHGILGEEHGASAGSDEFTWVIDPIDGTRAFILGQLHWGVLIALNDGTRPIVGVMHQPYVGETFVGSRHGAELRHAGQTRRLRTRGSVRLEDAIVCATDPSMFAPGAEGDAFHEIARRARMRRYGGDCYSYCLVAAGLVDLVIEAQLKPYDIQPLIPIIEAAGGTVTSWSGGQCYEGGQVLAAGSAEIHRAALEILRAGAAI